MAEIRNYGLLRHLRGEPSSHILRFRKGRLVASGRGVSLWFFPLSTSIVEVPADDRELSYLFHGRSADFQDLTAQGVITYRVTDPGTVSDRIDFTIDLRSGAHLRQPLDRLGLLLTQLAEQHAWSLIAATPLKTILTNGHEMIRGRIADGLREDAGLSALGIEVVSVRVSSISPTAELERALEMPTRELIQQEADEATFRRRAMAVEKERAIQENELENQIELAKKEELLIAQRGANEKRRAADESEARKIETGGQAERTRIEAEARADALRHVEGARVESEGRRMDIYRDLPRDVLLGLAARELASKLQKIDHLNLSPELLSPMLSRLFDAGASRLEGAG